MINDVLQSYNILTAQDIRHFEQLITHRHLDKDDFLISEGQYCKEVAFIQSGILRSFYTPESGEGITYCFSFPHTFVTAYSSLITGQPTSENIQAITACELLIIKKKDLDQLSANSLNWTIVLKRMAEQQYIELENRLFLFQREKASTRFQHLLNNHPDYIEQIPLNYLASYLGVTPRHLNRLRREFARTNVR